jgi:hydrogenase-4 component E
LTATLNLFLGVAMGLNLVALVCSRIPSVIRTAAMQGVVLGILPLIMEQEYHWLVGIASIGTVAVKGFLVPTLLRRALRAANIEREEQPLISYVPSLLLGAAATIATVGFAGILPLLPEHRDTLLVPAAFATIITGFLLLVGRSKAISQVCGYLILENGIFIFGLLLIRAMPLVVEAGILLDLTVAVFVIGIIVDRIQREFDTLDTRKLTSLRE